jgi:hypothetical protein
MSKIFGHKRCHSIVEVLPKKLPGVTEPMLLVTDKDGNIIAAKTINANLEFIGALTVDGSQNIKGSMNVDGTMTVDGSLTAEKVIGAVYM